MMKVLLTGGIGSGKSTVAKVFGVLGVPVFEADKVGRELLTTDSAVIEKVVGLFGTSVMKDQVLDRKRIAEVVFSDADALTRLNAIIHPVVQLRFRNWTEEHTCQYVIMEAAVIEAVDARSRFDRVIVVTAPEAMRVQRVIARDGVPKEAVEARMRNQMSEEERVAFADHIIVNDGTQLVVPQVLALHRELSVLA